MPNMISSLPPVAALLLDSPAFPDVAAEAVIEEIALYAGSAIGSAVVSFPASYALDAAPAMGAPAVLSLDGAPVFRGVVGQAPYRIDRDDDLLTLVLYDDKFRLDGLVVGEHGVGSWEEGARGYTAVGYDIVFNRDGRPNKDPEALDFSLASNAVSWTLKDVLELLFEYVVPATLATLDSETLPESYDLAPDHLDLSGLSALQAIDAIASLSGATWSLHPGAAADFETVSAFVSVHASSGTERVCRLAAPRAGARVSDADRLCPTSVNVGPSIFNFRSRFQTVSAPTVKEHLHSTSGASPLLVDADPVSSKFCRRLVVDPTAYETHNLGGNLASGSRPKPWLPALVSRPAADGASYLSAAAIAADPALRSVPPVAAPVLYITLPGSPAVRLLVLSGYSLDLDACAIDLEPALVVPALDGATEATEETFTLVTGDAWATSDFHLTVATRLEVRQSVTLDSETELPDAYTALSRRLDLVPEARGLSLLPDLSSTDRNAATQIDSAASPAYVDLEDQLTATATAALAAGGVLEVPVSLEFPLFPVLEIGDRLSIVNRDTPAVADTVVTEIVYSLAESQTVRVSATNVLGAVNPEKFIRPV
jgi:hypothetical protein